eukprot:TRINITY_DN2661_c0_g1_i2.p1 TRINITY_DN2661_c0_g1~~TRINITY_DN2661_c0_g1_i2.p1  ORF type:complete len:242 (+),score=69.79 TRINITY_DN2661_c0_g1_i2:148-873(+)
MRFDRLSLLMDQISTDIEKTGYYLADNTGTMVSKQAGVFRTNCIDNLDRTNVVQSLLARQALAVQLVQLGLARERRTVFEMPFEAQFKNIWANHADVISKQYSGTGAMKTDFTRTGKRTTQGAINDGINGLMRYYLNNFTDGFRQDALDLFVGNYTVDTHHPSPFRSKNAAYAALAASIMLVIAVVLLIFSAVLPPAPEVTWLHSLGMMLVWVVAIFGFYKGLGKFGKVFVDQPVLFLKNN